MARQPTNTDNARALAVLTSDTATFEMSYLPQEADTETIQACKMILVSASYDIQKETMSYWILLSIIRTILLLITVGFTSLYAKTMAFETSGNEWWLSPYVLVPERRFCILLLLSLIFILNPVMILMQFSSLAGSLYMRMIADTVVGAGIFMMLIAFLCLMQGIRYHTTTAIIDRRKQQRDLKVAQQAYLHVVQSSGDEHAPAYNGALDMLPRNGLALKHDVNSAFFARFIQPKVRIDEE